MFPVYCGWAINYSTVHSLPLCQADQERRIAELNSKLDQARDESSVLREKLVDRQNDLDGAGRELALLKDELEAAQRELQDRESKHIALVAEKDSSLVRL